MIQNPNRATYLQLGKDTERRQQRIDDLRTEYDMLNDMCQNKSIALVNIGMDHDQLRIEFKCLENTHYDLTQKISAARHEEYEINRWLCHKQTVVDQIALWEKNPQRAIKMWKRERLQQQHQERCACMYMLRRCFIEMSLVYLECFENNSLRYALRKIKLMHKGTRMKENHRHEPIPLIRRHSIEQIPELCIAGLWIDDDNCTEIRQRQRIIATVAQEAVNAYFYLAHCSCSRIGVILATEPRAPSQQVAVRRFEAVRRAHQIMATARLRQRFLHGARRAYLTGLEHIRPYHALSAYSRLAPADTFGLRADAPPWNYVTNRVEVITSPQMHDDRELSVSTSQNVITTSTVVPDSDMRFAARILQQMMQERQLNGDVNGDVNEIEIRVSNHRSVVFSRIGE